MATSQKLNDEYSEKCLIAIMLTNSELVDMISGTVDKEYFYIDTPLRFVLLIKSVVTLYTDLEFDQTNVLVQFNLLEQYGITEAIINAIGEDYDSFRTIVNMTLDDTMQNERSLISYLENLGQSFSVAMDEFVKKLTEAAEKEME